MESIPIEEHLQQFDKHLEINERTILSAKFGDGKTYFLDKFKDEYKEKGYYFVTLYPVNYSVVENGDIFEYIKRDILLQLAEDGFLDSIDLTAAIDSVFNWENLREVISFLLSFVPMGKFYDKLLEKAESFKQKYDEKKQNIEKYEGFFKNQKGGLYEKDGYTLLIEQALKYAKEHGKRTILIIEDLDRIDPAHLFRILNVLGAHIDERLYQGESKKNKFGFDNIITVFDYEITAHLFHHFYGERANYEGYINKFKKHNVFTYSIDDIARNHLYKFFDTECCIPLSYLEMLRKANDEALIRTMSVRDVNQVLSDIECHIDAMGYILNTVKINTNNSLTKTIALLRKMGLSDFKIRTFLEIQLDVSTFAKCLGEFVFYNSNVYTFSEFVIKNKYFELDIINGKIVSYRRESNVSQNEKNLKTHVDITNQVSNMIDIAFKFVKP